ncbi:hypothetical protein P8C59_001479 [Phyllachora maydis]|uniref:Uncharacterized protein n=1 Tax=Phyllachora maydis TaxID=1825666 RepID=A0AAD9M7X6_9PEZI|nr:hypothetical protein P8C59_001479 [Phyllachora maydis]
MDAPRAVPSHQPRPRISRRPGVLVVSVAAFGVGWGFSYFASKQRRNELAQKNSATPNLYVSVERSGGGV